MVFATELDPLVKSTQGSAERVKLDHTRLHSPHSTALKATASPQKVVPLRLGTSVRVGAVPLSLPKQPKLPFAIKLLTRLQQGSTAITCLLATSALVVYGSTVYVDKSTEYALTQIDQLQGESQQMTAANEAIKESLAEQAAQPGSGLTPYKAGDVLFLKPAPTRPLAEVNSAPNSTPNSAPKEERDRPMGY